MSFYNEPMSIYESLATTVIVLLLLHIYFTKKLREYDTSSVKLVKRKYLEITFYDGKMSYDIFLPYSKIKGLSSVLVRGKTTKRTYRINGAFIPSLSAKDLGEESLIYELNDQIIEVDRFDEITF